MPNACGLAERTFLLPSLYQESSVPLGCHPKVGMNDGLAIVVHLKQDLYILAIEVYDAGLQWNQRPALGQASGLCREEAASLRLQLWLY